MLSKEASSRSFTVVSSPMPIRSDLATGRGGLVEEEGGNRALRCLAICFGISAWRYLICSTERKDSEML